MGCAFTKNDGNSGGDTNKDVNSQNQKGPPGAGGGQPEQPQADPRLPLNTRQKFNISKSWKGIVRAMEPTGVNMFVKLFEENQELLNLFTKFQTLKTKQSQLESMELAQHATMVMSTIDEAINSLDNIDYFIEYLHSIGKLHHKVPDFKKEYFWKIEKPFLMAVKETLEDRYTENMENIYKITIKFILEKIVEGYEEGTADSKDINVVVES